MLFRKIVPVLFLSTAVFLAACDGKENGTEKIRELSYAIVAGDEIPDRLSAAMMERQKEPFQLTYGDGDALYLAKGAGEQQAGGFTIEVLELFETADSIVFETELKGPGTESVVDSNDSCPMIVVKTEYSELPVLFQ